MPPSLLLLPLLCPMLLCDSSSLLLLPSQGLSQQWAAVPCMQAFWLQHRHLALGRETLPVPSPPWHLWPWQLFPIGCDWSYTSLDLVFTVCSNFGSAAFLELSASSLYPDISPASRETLLGVSLLPQSVTKKQCPFHTLAVPDPIPVFSFVHWHPGQYSRRPEPGPISTILKDHSAHSKDSPILVAHTFVV